MADPLSSLNGFLEGLNLSFGNPVGLATNVFLSSIVGGIVILIIVEIFAKKFSEEVNPMHAFLLAFIVSMINMFGLIPLLGGFVSALPFAGILVMVLPVLVWFVLVKLFFGDLELLHVLVISVVCYLLSIYLIPMLVSMLSGFIPI